MKYISIDGDDIGRKITSYYLSNDSENLSKLSSELKISTEKIAFQLQSIGFSVLFCAADGVVASTKLENDFNNLFDSISKLAPNGITFSAGVGSSPREAYIALISAKSNGKNCLHQYSDLDSLGLE